MTISTQASADIPTQDPADSALMGRLLAAVDREFPGFDSALAIWSSPAVIVLRMRVRAGRGDVVVEVPLTCHVDPAPVDPDGVQRAAIAVRSEEDVLDDIEAAICCGTHFGILRCEARPPTPGAS